VVGKPGIPICDCNESIPNIPVQELGPTVFERMIQGVPRPTRIPGEAGLLQLPDAVLPAATVAAPPRVTGTDPAVFGPLLDPARTTSGRRLTG